MTCNFVFSHSHTHEVLGQDQKNYSRSKISHAKGVAKEIGT